MRPDKGHEAVEVRSYSTTGHARIDSALTSSIAVFTLKAMELHLNPEIEARLLQHATRTGKAAAQIVEEAVDRLLEYETRFAAAIEDGRASARRGALLGHDEVVTRIDRLFQA